MHVSLYSVNRWILVHISYLDFTAHGINIVSLLQNTDRCTLLTHTGSQAYDSVPYWLHLRSYIS